MTKVSNDIFELLKFQIHTKSLQNNNLLELKAVKRPVVFKIEDNGAEFLQIERKPFF